MRRTFLQLFAALPLAAALACGGGDSTPSDSATTAATPAATTPDLTDAGGIVGGVSFSGTAPTAHTVQMDADPYCLLAHSEQVQQTPVVVDEGGGLANVFVYVKEGLEGMIFPGPTEPIYLDQNGCLYTPHVIAVRTGQSLIVKNSDDTLHNINVQPQNNPAFNIGQPIAGMETEKSFPNTEIGIPARCDVHPWMSGFIGVFDHPYYAVSAGGGSFSIDRLPAGDYVVEAWHESLGTRTQNVTVSPNETTEISFDFEG